VAGSGRPRRFLTRRAFLWMLGKTVLGSSLTGFGGLLYAKEVESRWLDVVQLDLRLPRLSSQFEGYRIVHISDLHLDRHTPSGYLDEVQRLVNGEEADLISFTGDFVNFDAGGFAPGLTSLTRGLEATDGVLPCWETTSTSRTRTW
jgi:predicted MPP superfamily phosphohydrolase